MLKTADLVGTGQIPGFSLWLQPHVTWRLISDPAWDRLQHEFRSACFSEGEWKGG